MKSLIAERRGTWLDLRHPAMITEACTNINYSDVIKN